MNEPLRRYLMDGTRHLRLPVAPEQVDRLAGYVAQRAAADRPPQVQLSKRRQAILAALAVGETTEATARRLGITGHTVKTHRRHLFELLGARTSAHAVAIGYATGLLRPPSAPAGGAS